MSEYSSHPIPSKPSPARMREINDSILYAMWSVFSVETPLGDADREGLAKQAHAYLEEIQQGDLEVRGVYDISGMRADADLMIWWHAPTIEELQAAYKGFLRTDFGSHLKPVWSCAAIHRPAEFNKSHIPAFAAGEVPREYICVYPFVRSYDWYLLPESERRTMLAEHGLMAREYGDVRSNTVASFALNDYEWILAFEADTLFRLTDLMRELRAAQIRQHVREEVPFFTGPRVDITDLIPTLR